VASISHCLVAGILVLAVGTAEGTEWIVEGRVVGVSDGDTIAVLDDSKTEHKIRFAGIDAPEKGQAFGEQSKQSPIGARIPEARRGPLPQGG
jgi:endonuclease YncB( thermonuclease family)